jgi:hypothetical protein
MGTSKNVFYWVKAPLKWMFITKMKILASIIFVWLNTSNTKGFCDPHASITFEKENPNVCFVNAMWVLHLKYFKSNFIFVTQM